MVFKKTLENTSFLSKMNWIDYRSIFIISQKTDVNQKSEIGQEIIMSTTAILPAFIILIKCFNPVIYIKKERIMFLFRKINFIMRTR